MEPTRRTEIRGRLAYDAVLQRIRILENEESPAEPSEFYGHYFYFKEVPQAIIELANLVIIIHPCLCDRGWNTL
jgi:hypothetical protein